MPTTIKFNHSNYAYDKFCVNRIEIPFEITLRFQIQNQEFQKLSTFAGYTRIEGRKSGNFSVYFNS